MKNISLYSYLTLIVFKKFCFGQKGGMAPLELCPLDSPALRVWRGSVSNWLFGTLLTFSVKSPIKIQKNKKRGFERLFLIKSNTLRGRYLCGKKFRGIQFRWFLPSDGATFTPKGLLSHPNIQIHLASITHQNFWSKAQSWRGLNISIWSYKFSI